MATFGLLVGAVTEVLITGAVVGGSVALNDIADDAAAAGQPSADFEVQGFSPAPEGNAQGSDPKPQHLSLPTADDDEDFTAMVMAAAGRPPRPPPPGPPRPRDPPRPREPTQPPKERTIGLAQTVKAGIADIAIQAAIKYLSELEGVDEEKTHLINFFKEADTALRGMKAGNPLNPVIAKVNEAHNHLLSFVQQLSDPEFIRKHFPQAVNLDLLAKAFGAWKAFIPTLLV
jgi:hypothetical protein